MFIVLASDGLTNVMAPLQLMAVVDEQEQINKQAKENVNSSILWKLRITVNHPHETR